MKLPSGRAALYVLIYLTAMAGIFGALGLLVADNADALRVGLLKFFLPDSLVGVADYFAEPFIQRNLPEVLNLLVTSMLVIIPMLTFPLKELASARYEADLRSGDPGWSKPDDLPLWRQSLDELLLLAVFIGLVLLALRLTLTPGLAVIGSVMTHLILTVSFAVDFMGPTLSRHHVTPSDIYRVIIVKYPLQSLGFGFLLSLPPLAAAKVVPRIDDPVMGFVLLAVVNVVCIVVALLVGTVAGTKLADRVKELRPVSMVFKGFFWATLLATLVFNGLFFGSGAKALYEVTPILKLKWSYVSDSLEFEAPGLTNPTARLSFQVDVTNPTSRDARIGDNSIVLMHKGDEVATTKLPEFSVAADATARQHVSFHIGAGGGLLKKGWSVLKSISDDGVLGGLSKALSGAGDLTAYRADLRIPLTTGQLKIPLLGDPGSDPKP